MSTNAEGETKNPVSNTGGGKPNTAMQHGNARDEISQAEMEEAVRRLEVLLVEATTWTAEGRDLIASRRALIEPTVTILKGKKSHGTDFPRSAGLDKWLKVVTSRHRNYFTDEQCQLDLSLFLEPEFQRGDGISTEEQGQIDEESGNKKKSEHLPDIRPNAPDVGHQDNAGVDREDLLRTVVERTTPTTERCGSGAQAHAGTTREQTHGRRPSEEMDVDGSDRTPPAARYQWGKGRALLKRAMEDVDGDTDSEMMEDEDEDEDEGSQETQDDTDGESGLRDTDAEGDYDSDGEEHGRGESERTGGEEEGDEGDESQAEDVIESSREDGFGGNVEKRAQEFEDERQEQHQKRRKIYKSPKKDTQVRRSIIRCDWEMELNLVPCKLCASTQGQPCFKQNPGQVSRATFSCYPCRKRGKGCSLSASRTAKGSVGTRGEDSAIETESKPKVEIGATGADCGEKGMVASGRRGKDEREGYPSSVNESHRDDPLKPTRNVGHALRREGKGGGEEAELHLSGEKQASDGPVVMPQRRSGGGTGIKADQATRRAYRGAEDDSGDGGRPFKEGDSGRSGDPVEVANKGKDLAVPTRLAQGSKHSRRRRVQLTAKADSTREPPKRRADVGSDGEGGDRFGGGGRDRESKFVGVHVDTRDQCGEVEPDEMGNLVGERAGTSRKAGKLPATSLGQPFTFRRVLPGGVEETRPESVPEALGRLIDDQQAVGAKVAEADSQVRVATRRLNLVDEQLSTIQGVVNGLTTTQDQDRTNQNNQFKVLEDAIAKQGESVRVGNAFTETVSRRVNTIETHHSTRLSAIESQLPGSLAIVQASTCDAIVSAVVRQVEEMFVRHRAEVRADTEAAFSAMEKRLEEKWKVALGGFDMSFAFSPRPRDEISLVDRGLATTGSTHDWGTAGSTWHGQHFDAIGVTEGTNVDMEGPVPPSTAQHLNSNPPNAQLTTHSQAPPYPAHANERLTSQLHIRSTQSAPLGTRSHDNDPHSVSPSELNAAAPILTAPAPPPRGLQLTGGPDTSVRDLGQAPQSVHNVSAATTQQLHTSYYGDGGVSTHNDPYSFPPTLTSGLQYQEGGNTVGTASGQTFQPKLSMSSGNPIGGTTAFSNEPVMEMAPSISQRGRMFNQGPAVGNFASSVLSASSTATQRTSQVVFGSARPRLSTVTSVGQSVDWSQLGSPLTEPPSTNMGTGHSIL